LNTFAKTLERYRYGILNHCDYPIHTGKLKGVNNRIKVIKRKAYGSHDLRYFTLKIYQACYYQVGEEPLIFQELIDAMLRNLYRPFLS
jgi:hypothetical protein